MATEDDMTIDERYKYLRTMQKRYLQANRPKRSALLDEMEQVTALHRKSLVRLMQGAIERTPRRRQRGRTYGPAVDDALRVIAESFDYICAERLAPNLTWMAESLAQHGELTVTPELLTPLEQISDSTVRRILQRVHQDEPRLPRRGPEQANRVAREIPMTRIPWDEQEPGHLEVDLVHHCGRTTAGEYVHTLQMIDVATGWSERVAVLGRSYRVIADAFAFVLSRIPFPILEIHVDNGSEFLNDHVVRFWHSQQPAGTITRSRPYRKNDNRFVEQKNDTLVRAYLGTERLDSVAQTLALNHLYEQMWLYYNCFQPVMRLAEKVYVPAGGRTTSRVIRRYDEARTPFERLCATPAASPDRIVELAARRQSTNPRQLRRDIYASIDQLFALPGAPPDGSENIFATLFFPNGHEPAHPTERGHDRESTRFTSDIPVTLSVG